MTKNLTLDARHRLIQNRRSTQIARTTAANAAIRFPKLLLQPVQQVHTESMDFPTKWSNCLNMQAFNSAPVLPERQPRMGV
jgi:hypothetical protein